MGGGHDWEMGDGGVELGGMGDGWNHPPESVPDDVGDAGAQASGRNLTARVLGAGAALIITFTAAVIGFSAGNGGSSDTVLAIGDATVPPSEVSRPRVGPVTTSTVEATPTTEEAAPTSAPSTTVPPTTTSAPAEPTPDTTPPSTDPDDGEDDVARPPGNPEPPGDDESDDDTEEATVHVPDVWQMQRDEAVSQLENAGFSVSERSTRAWGDWWRNRVQEQSPAGGESADVGSTVTIWVGSGRR